MNNDARIKFLTELMKAFGTFIVGTGAGIYALITTENPNETIYAFTIFVISVAALALILFLFCVWELFRLTK